MNLPETTERRGGITPPAASVVSLPLASYFTSNLRTLHGNLVYTLFVSSCDNTLDCMSW